MSAESDSEAELQAILDEFSKKKSAKQDTEKTNEIPSASKEVNSDRKITTDKRRHKNHAKRRPKRKLDPVDQPKSDYEKYLDKLIFGDKDALLENLKEAAGDGGKETTTENAKRKPVWHDSDDEEFHVGDVIIENKRTGPLDHLDRNKKYSELLQSRFHRMQAPPKWADLNRAPDSDSEEELLKSVGHLSNKITGALPANNIHLKRLKDLNRATYAEGGVTSIQFHPGSTVGIVAGYRGVATIYSIDGRKNEKLHSVKFEDFPIKCMKLLPDGNCAIIGGDKAQYYSFDLMLGEATRCMLPKVVVPKLNKFVISPCGNYMASCGRFGEIHLFDTNSKELLKTLKQENRCTALQFDENSTKLLAHSQGSDITIFDLRQEKIEHIFTDDGCIHGKELAISANSRMLATGSNEGVVNVYNYSDVFKSKNPTPQKVIYNLTTSISNVKFNHSSEVLGICSESIPNAVKLVHFPSGTVFQNFPQFQAKIGAVRVVEFSPGSGYLALGCLTPEVSLYRLEHFRNY